MKNKLLVLISLIMIVLSTSAFAKVVEKMPTKRGSLYYEHFSTNLANGQYEKYHENGRLEERGTYKTGKPDGLSERYYENGQLEVRMTAKNGKLDGLIEFYYDNGKLLERGTYKNGKKDGLFEFYGGGLGGGTLTEKCFWVKGKEYECEYP